MVTSTSGFSLGSEGMCWEESKGGKNQDHWVMDTEKIFNQTLRDFVFKLALVKEDPGIHNVQQKQEQRHSTTSF